MHPGHQGFHSLAARVLLTIVAEGASLLAQMGTPSKNCPYLLDVLFPPFQFVEFSLVGLAHLEFDLAL